MLAFVLFLLAVAFKSVAVILLTTIAVIFLGELCAALLNTLLWAPNDRPSLRRLVGYLLGGSLGSATAVYLVYSLTERFWGPPLWQIVLLAPYPSFALAQWVTKESQQGAQPSGRPVDAAWPASVMLGATLGMLLYGQRFLTPAPNPAEEAPPALVREVDDFPSLNAAWSAPADHRPYQQPSAAEVYGKRDYDWRYDIHSEWAEKDYRDQMRQDFAR